MKKKKILQMLSLIYKINIICRLFLGADIPDVGTSKQQQHTEQ